MERTFIRVRNEGFRRLADTERVKSARPLQFYPVEGKKVPDRLTAEFGATSPDCALEPFIATVARDGQMAVAFVAESGLFLFNNCEYSCIHVNPDFGDLAPGQQKQLRGKLYFIQGGLDEAYQRYQEDFR